MSARKRKLKSWRSSHEELVDLDAAIMEIIRQEREVIGEFLRLSIRHVFYQVAMKGLVPKTDKAFPDKEWKDGRSTPSGSDLVERRIKELRDTGPMPWDWIRTAPAAASTPAVATAIWVMPSATSRSVPTSGSTSRSTLSCGSASWPWRASSRTSRTSGTWA